MRHLSWITFTAWIVFSSGADSAQPVPTAPVATAPVAAAPVAAALEQLEAWLADGPHAAGWRDYLHVDQLRKELRSGELGSGELGSGRPPDLHVFEATLKRLAADEPGLDRPQFLALRTALEGWLARASLPEGARLKAVTDSLEQRFAAYPKLGRRDELLLVAERGDPHGGQRDRQQFHNHLIALRALLGAYAERPSAWLAEEIGATLDWLSTRGGAEPLVAAVRDYYGHPNIWIDVSEKAMTDGVAGAIERPIVVEDSILGTAVRGHGLTKATKRLVFEPHAERAVLTLHVRGTIDTRTVGRNGPARIDSEARTTFRAEKKFWLTEQGVKSFPTLCTAATTTLSADVSAAARGIRGRIVKRVAQRQVWQQQTAADRIAARHAEAEIRDIVDQEATALVSRIEECAVTPLLALANGSGGSVRLRFCSAKGLLKIGLVLGPLGAPPNESGLPLESGFAIRLHSTVVERLMQHPWAETALASLQFGNPLTSGITAILPASLVKKADSWSQRLTHLTGAVPLETAAAPAPVLSGERLENAIEQWLNHLLAPEITRDGVALRGGRLGTLAPGGLGSDWTSLAWSTQTR